MPTQGLFVVLEGVDGAGTTTQAHRLADSLRGQGRAVHLTEEPSKGPIGMLLRQVLTGRLITAAAPEMRSPSWSTMALMFAADRLDHLEAEIAPRLAEGTTVICDRYYHSSLAYQSVTGGRSPETVEWIRQVNSLALSPDLTIVLDVSPEVARGRRGGRPGAEMYEREGLQQELCDVYKSIDKHFVNERIVHVNADAPFDGVAREIVRHVKALGPRG